MGSELVRFGVAMEKTLLDELDGLVEARGMTRSELLRDLARAEVVRAQVAQGVPAVASLTLVYDHHVRDLTERLNDIQHELGDRVRSTMHVHLDEHYCMEVVVMRGRSDDLQRVGERLLALRGVKHGGMEIVSEAIAPEDRAPERATKQGHHAHAHPAGHPHSHAPASASKVGRARQRP